MRQLPVELSSIGRGAAPHAPADNIKSAPIWQNSRSVMALIRCTLPASKPYPPSLYPFHAESPRALRVSTVSSAVSTLYTFSFTTFLPPLRYLPTTRRVSFARFSFPSFFFFFPSLSLSMKGISPIQHARYPCVCVLSPRVTLLLLVHHCHE